MSVRLLDRVSTLLSERKRVLTYQIISENTGVSVAKISRLSRASTGAADGMSANDVQLVYEFVAGKPLIEA